MHFIILEIVAPSPTGFPRESSQKVVITWPLSLSDKPSTLRFSWKKYLSFLTSLLPALEPISGRILSDLSCMLPCCPSFQLLGSHLFESKGSELKSWLCQLLERDTEVLEMVLGSMFRK